jgi:hypothetical protein
MLRAMSTRHGVLFTLFAVIFTWGCEPAELDRCVQVGDCGSKLECVNGRCLSPDAANDRCKNNEQYAKACEQHGECTWKETKCIVAGPEDCKNSKGCKSDATCTFDPKGACIIGGSHDCKSSEFCSKLQRCMLDETTKKCVPGSDAECKAQTDCKAAAACTFDAATKTCIPSVSDCKESPMCEHLGLCALDKAKNRCVPGSEEDCKLTVDCKAGGICGWDEASKSCVKAEAEE